MQAGSGNRPSDAAMVERNLVLHLLAAASFLIFFQSYLVAPLIPSLAAEFRASPQVMGLLVPAYMIAYGISTLFYGPLSDRIGRRGVLLVLLAAMVITTLGLASAHSVAALVAWRIAAGVSAGGVIPIALALLGDLYEYHERGRPIGWIFGAIAGGMAVGSSAGALLNQSIGWRWELVGIAALSAGVFVMGYLHRALLEGNHVRQVSGIMETLGGYAVLLKNPRGFRTYTFIALNGMFHSGMFTWLGEYFSKRYGLQDRGIGLALLGYGIPGMLLGPALGRAADRFGRGKLIPIGLLIGALAGASLALRSPLMVPTIAVTLLSLGLDMSHPLLAGIVTSLDPLRRGQAMALNAFVLFMGFGLGPLLFQELLFSGGFAEALLIFSGGELLIFAASIRLFRKESPGQGV